MNKYNKSKVGWLSAFLLLVALMVTALTLSSCDLFGGANNCLYLFSVNGGGEGTVTGRSDSSYINLELPVEETDEDGKIWMKKSEKMLLQNLKC